MSRLVLVFALALSLCSLQTFGASVSSEVKTESGTIPVLIDQPGGKGPFPLLVIAPAKGYLMKERLFQNLASEAAKAGFLAVRFNWLFTLKKEKPSEGFYHEAVEIEAVVSHFMGRADIRKDKVILAAKSMGSKAAMKSSLEKYAALLLLTPNCDQTDTFKKLYHPIFELKKPVQITISAQDPYCQIEQIYAAAPELAPFLTLHTLAGDHNFALEAGKNFENQDSAIESSINWLKNRLR